MAKTINIRFHLSREDIVKALRAYALRQPRNWIMLILSGSAAAALLGRLAQQGQADEYTPWGIFAAVVFVAYALWVLLVNPWLEGRRFAGSGLLTLERNWTVEPKGLHIRVVSPQGKSADTRFKWEKIKRFYQTPGYYLLLDGSAKPGVHILPARAFGSGRKQQDFVKMVVGEMKNVKVVKK